MAAEVNRAQALSFDPVAAEYAAARPAPPPAVFDALEEVGGRALVGADVLDCGAGTGIVTRGLRQRGARVTALEPGPGMAAQLRRAEPEAPVVRALGDQLPFADGSFDLLTYADAWHWTDPARAVPEALRVLRPGGVLALWWNQVDVRVPWVAEQDARLVVSTRSYPATVPEVFDGYPVRTAVREVGWSRRIAVDLHVAALATRSSFLMLEAGERARRLEAERRVLAEVFPDGWMDEPYRCGLTVAVTGGG